MNTLCAGMTGIAVFRTMEDVEDLSQYGLDIPAVTITVTDVSGNEITVALGNNNDSAGVIYAVREGDRGCVYASAGVIYAVREGDRGCVYAVTPSIRTAVQKKLGDLAEKA